MPMLWVYGHYKYFAFSGRGSTLDVRIWRLKSVPALKEDGIFAATNFGMVYEWREYRQEMEIKPITIKSVDLLQIDYIK